MLKKQMITNGIQMILIYFDQNIWPFEQRQTRFPSLGVS